MARPAGTSPEIKAKADHAHELMNRKRNPLSVRKACDAAGVSPASYYKVYPAPAQEQTNTEAGTQVAATVRKEGSPARKQRKRRATSGNTGRIVKRNPSVRSENVTDLKNYISKLERKIVRLSLDSDEEE